MVRSQSSSRGSAFVAAALAAACGTSDAPESEGAVEAVAEESAAGAEGRDATSLEFSRPLAGLTPELRARFEAGREEFEGTEGIADGLGPVFNEDSCTDCHSVGGTGGGSNVFETRFGRRSGASGFDPLEHLGGTLVQQRGIGAEGAPDPDCHFTGEAVPPQANTTALRRSTPLFGLGLVDAVPDASFHALARRQEEKSPATAGRVSVATNRANQDPAVAKFGWKAQIQTLLEFSANAYLNEMGITSPMFPVENCPNGDPDDCPILERCNPMPAINDDGEDVQLFADFMTLLAPPPRGPITPDVVRGEEVFSRIGCADCHAPTLRTGSHPIAALSDKVFHPYSDFLLHDMGSLADGIGGDQADASGIEAVATRHEMRTQPLWGLRILDRFLHDGRAETLAQAIEAHDGQGASARDGFAGLSSTDRELLIEFLESL
jgi:CxxC motif-containing protein (DUF1111 family)